MYRIVVCRTPDSYRLPADSSIVSSILVHTVTQTMSRLQQGEMLCPPEMTASEVLAVAGTAAVRSWRTLHSHISKKSGNIAGFFSRIPDNHWIANIRPDIQPPLAEYLVHPYYWSMLLVLAVISQFSLLSTFAARCCGRHSSLSPVDAYGCCLCWSLSPFAIISRYWSLLLTAISHVW